MAIAIAACAMTATMMAFRTVSTAIGTMTACRTAMTAGRTTPIAANRGAGFELRFKKDPVGSHPAGFFLLGPAPAPHLRFGEEFGLSWVVPIGKEAHPWQNCLSTSVRRRRPS